MGMAKCYRPNLPAAIPPVVRKAHPYSYTIWLPTWCMLWNLLVKVLHDERRISKTAWLLFGIATLHCSSKRRMSLIWKNWRVPTSFRHLYLPCLQRYKQEPFTSWNKFLDVQPRGAISYPLVWNTSGGHVHWSDLPHYVCRALLFWMLRVPFW